MKKLIGLLLMSHVILLSACSGTTLNDASSYQSLAADEKIFYGNLIFNPKTAGGAFDKENFNPGDREYGPDYKRGWANICKEDGECVKFNKATNFAWDKEDYDASGLRKLDADDVFAFKAKIGDTVSIRAIQIDEGYNSYIFRFKRPVLLEGKGRITYVGDLFVQLRKLNDPAYYGANFEVKDGGDLSRENGIKKLNIPSNEIVETRLPDFKNAKYRISTSYSKTSVMVIPVVK